MGYKYRHRLRWDTHEIPIPLPMGYRRDTDTDTDTDADEIPAPHSMRRRIAMLCCTKGTKKTAPTQEPQTRIELYIRIDLPRL